MRLGVGVGMKRLVDELLLGRNVPYALVRVGVGIVVHLFEVQGAWRMMTSHMMRMSVEVHVEVWTVMRLSSGNRAGALSVM